LTVDGLAFFSWNIFFELFLMSLLSLVSRTSSETTTMDHATEIAPLERLSTHIDPVIADNLQIMPQMRRQPERRRLRVAVLTALAVILALLLADALTEQRVKKASIDFVGWVEEHPFRGVIAVILAYIVATVLFVPASILTLGTGYAFRSAFNSIGKGVALASTVSHRRYQMIKTSEVSPIIILYSSLIPLQ
jgi:hypothetical protein